MSGGARIGIVASGDLSRHVLQHLLRDAGYDAGCFSHQQLAACLDNVDGAPDAWLLDASDADVDDALEQIVSRCEAPLLVNDEAPPVQQPAAFALWRRRLLDKVEELVGSIGGQAYPQAAPPLAVWVLAASTGGPEAVGKFLAALRPGLPIALVYAQHIDPSFERLLADALSRFECYDIRLCRGEHHLRPGTVLVLPADAQVRFLPLHRALATGRPWSGVYQPAIDQVIAELAHLYRRACGVIVFSGLCDDGALGCRVVRGNGGLVWAQTPESCISPDMPNAALATGAVSLSGTPEQLAHALGALYPA